MAESRQFSHNPFWDFSNRIYDENGVEPACMALQTKLGLDVNLILFFCWLAEQGYVALSHQDILRYCDLIADWHNRIIQPLRAARNELKGGFKPAPEKLTQDMRQQILAVELDCEHIEQQVLFQAAKPRLDKTNQPRHIAAVANLNLYCFHLKIQPDQKDIENLVFLVQSIAGGDPDSLTNLFTRAPSD